MVVPSERPNTNGALKYIQSQVRVNPNPNPDPDFNPNPNPNPDPNPKYVFQDELRRLADRTGSSSSNGRRRASVHV